MVSSAAHWRSVLAEVDQVALCSHPVRLRGVTLDRSPGSWPRARSSSRARTAGPPSARRARVSTRPTPGSLVAAGIRGGKGVDASVVEHPQLFVTLTAPSFGAVHSGPSSTGIARSAGPGGVTPVPHGRALSCRVRHEAGAIVLGDPLCPECFDYRGAVLWNAHVPRLWERTCHRLTRLVARPAGSARPSCARWPGSPS